MTAIDGQFSLEQRVAMEQISEAWDSLADAERQEVTRRVVARIRMQHAATPDTAIWHTNNDFDEQEAKR